METAEREASRVYRELEAWRDAHPDATLGLKEEIYNPVNRVKDRRLHVSEEG